MELVFGQPEVSNTTNIRDIQVPPEMRHPVSTGHAAADHMFEGRGMIASTVTLLTGLPGGGKTSFVMQVADAITQSGNLCLFNSAEMSIYQVAKMADRLQLQHGFVPAYHRHVDDIIAQLNQLQQANPEKKIFLAQDSLQALEPSKVDLTTGIPKKKVRSGLLGQVEAMEELTTWVKETFSFLFCIGQVTKEGVFAGKNEVKHMVDAHLHLGMDLERRSKTYGQRRAEMQKNRFGKAGTIFPFTIDERGLHFMSTPKTAAPKTPIVRKRPTKKRSSPQRANQKRRMTMAEFLSHWD